MKKCTLTFIIGDKEISVDVDPSTEILNSDGSLNQDELAKVFKDHAKKKYIVDTIIDNKGSSTLLKKGDFSTALPNNTIQTLRNQFSGEVDFGKHFEANVLLVSRMAYKGNHGIPSYRTVVNGQEKFVIRRDELHQFAAYTRLRSAINDFMSDTSSFTEDQKSDILLGDNGLFNLVSRLSSTNIKRRDAQDINDDIQAIIDYSKEDFETQKTDLETQLENFDVNQALDRIRQKVTQRKLNQEEENAIHEYDTNGNIKKLKTVHENYLKNKIKQLEKKLANIENGKFTTPEITELRHELNQPESRKIPTDVKLFLEDFINNPGFYQKNLSTSDYLSVSNFLRMISGKSDKRKYGERIADLINMKLIYPIQDKTLKSRQIKIKTDDLIKILIENLELSQTELEQLQDKLNLKFDLISNYLNKHFLSFSDYELVTNSGQFDKNKDMLILEAKFDTFETLLDQNSYKELYNNKNIFDYKGHHIYSLTIKGKKQYWFSDHYVGLSDTSFKFYDSIEDVISAIDKKVSSMYIHDFSKENFEKSNISNRSIFSVKVNRFYQENGVISKYTHPYGPHRVYDMTIEEFYTWLSGNFDQNQYDKILNWLQNKTEIDENQDILEQNEEEYDEWNQLNNNFTNIDLEKAAIFLSYFGYVTDGLNPRSQFRVNNDDLNKFIDNFKDEKIYYSVVSYYEIDKRKYINVIKNTSGDTAIIDYDTQNNRPKPILFSLQALADEFTKRGIPTQVIYNTDIEDILHIKESPKAFVKDGVIYLNGSKASISDGYHEYTHILLGMLKSQKPEAYEKLLRLYSNLFDPEYIEKKITSLRNQYQNLYKNATEFDMLEELFAEDYGNFLIKGSMSKHVNLFTQLDIEAKEASNDFFNKINPEDYENLTLYKLLNGFSSAIQRNMKTRQFVLSNNEEDLAKREEAVEKFIKGAKSITTSDPQIDQFDQESDLLKYCKE